MQTLLADVENRINVQEAHCIAARKYTRPKHLCFAQDCERYNCIHLGEFIYFIRLCLG